MLSCRSVRGGGKAEEESWEEGREGAISVEVMEEAGDRREEEVEEVVVVLLRERPLKTERRLGLLGRA